LYFSGLSLRRVSGRLSDCFIKRNHVSIWNCIQKYKPEKISLKKKKILEYIIDKTIIKVGLEYVWLWVIIEPKHKEIQSFHLSKERKMFVAERFLSNVLQKYGMHSVYTDW